MLLVKQLKFAGAALAASVALGVAGQATAGTVIADYLSLKGGRADGVVDTIAAGGRGGLFLFDRLGGTDPRQLVQATGKPVGQFHGICLEFNEGLGGNSVTYDLISLGLAPVDGSSAPVMGTAASGANGTRADDLALLLGGVYSDFSQTLTDATAFALQLAVWEIANEKYGSGVVYQVAGGAGAGIISFTTGSANPDFATAMTLAQTWLTNINGGNLLGWTAAGGLLAISVGPPDFDQDFVVQTDGRLVPIPAAAWLLGSGLMGLFGFARRRKAA